MNSENFILWTVQSGNIGLYGSDYFDSIKSFDKYNNVDFIPTGNFGCLVSYNYFSRIFKSDITCLFHIGPDGEVSKLVKGKTNDAIKNKREEYIRALGLSIPEETEEPIQ